jgi:hypothetical protein
MEDGATDDAIDGEPGYCQCCRGFHLLRAVEVPQLQQTVNVCRPCAALGPGGLAFQMAGMYDDGTFGYEDPLPANPPGKRRRHDRLAESLLFAEPERGGGFEGFGPAHRGLGQRARIAWLRLRGRI